jgi:hypothetical protein
VRRTIFGLILVALTVSCTTLSPPASGPTGPTTQPSRASVRFHGLHFDVQCTPVAEALVDIELPHEGQPAMRAITGLWAHQAVAVLANDPKGCGLWSLAVATGLSATTKTQIEEEAARGVEHFGVTASPVPRDDGSA